MASQTQASATLPSAVRTLVVPWCAGTIIPAERSKSQRGAREIR